MSLVEQFALKPWQYRTRVIVHNEWAELMKYGIQLSVCWNSYCPYLLIYLYIDHGGVTSMTFTIHCANINYSRIFNKEIICFRAEVKLFYCWHWEGHFFHIGYHHLRHFPGRCKNSCCEEWGKGAVLHGKAMKLWICTSVSNFSVFLKEKYQKIYEDHE